MENVQHPKKAEANAYQVGHFPSLTLRPVTRSARAQSCAAKSCIRALRPQYGPQRILARTPPPKHIMGRAVSPDTIDNALVHKRPVSRSKELSRQGDIVLGASELIPIRCLRVLDFDWMSC